MNLRTLLGMPSSNLPPRLVTPHRGTDTRDPKQALTPEELAQVRADLALVEPHACTSRVWWHMVDADGYARQARPRGPECGKPAVVQRLLACGYVGYRCAEHEANGHGYRTSYCPGCNLVCEGDAHVVAVLPC